jgi:hypothetical protein
VTLYEQLEALAQAATPSADVHRFETYDGRIGVFVETYEGACEQNPSITQRAADAAYIAAASPATMLGLIARLRRCEDALESAEEFVVCATAWEGTNKEERDETLAEIRAAQQAADEALLRNPQVIDAIDAVKRGEYEVVDD